MGEGRTIVDLYVILLNCSGRDMLELRVSRSRLGVLSCHFKYCWHAALRQPQETFLHVKSECLSSLHRFHRVSSTPFSRSTKIIRERRFVAVLLSSRAQTIALQKHFYAAITVKAINSGLLV